jgi:hypothetical protein
MELELTKLVNGNLEIRADEEYRGELMAMQEDWDQRGVDADSRLAEVLEHYLANGWEWVQPEEIGALTAAPILSDDVERDDEGKIVKAGKVYWYPQYEVFDPLEQLIQTGSVIFTGVIE